MNAFVNTTESFVQNLFFSGSASDGLLVLLILLVFLVVLLLMARAGKIVILIVLMPIILTVATNRTQFFNIPLWIPIMAFIVLGALFYAIYALVLR